MATTCRSYVLTFATKLVDLIYLDPPFNSNASYNVLFKAPSGEQSQAQIEAFDDTWHWNESAERAFDEVLNGSHAEAAIMLKAMRSALGENDMMAYLANGRATYRTAQGLEADRKPLPSLRSDREPLPQDFAGRGFWTKEFLERNNMAADIGA